MAYRYPGDEDGERPGPVDFRDADVTTYTWTPVPALTGGPLHTVIGCYQYQSCEHRQWRNSTAKALTDKLDAPVKDLEYVHEYWGI